MTALTIAEPGRAYRALLDAALESPPPCTGRDEWLSARAEDVAVAARGCRACPLITACGRASDEVMPSHGTWAGVEFVLSNDGKRGRPAR